tara:strand:+ start:1102 stop:1590 length:489 start_codon:yes stop_codon:yes gene_type:complete
MINLKKVFILSFSILLPIIIYFFLRFFGNNTYEVSQVRYDCYNTLLSFNLQNEATFENIFLIDVRSKSKNPLVDNLLNKLHSNKEIDIITLSSINRNLNWEVIETNFFELNKGLKCFDKDVGDDHVLLVDKNFMVRGIYNLNDLDEFDRLNVEIDIINQYEK